MTDSVHHGTCLCGGVMFRIDGPMRPVVACHCKQCRKTSGHFWAATQVEDKNLQITSDETLHWYSSSDAARRGFCNNCGSSLFWKQDGDDRTSIGAGTLEETGLTISKHIYTTDKGDYYGLPEGEVLL